MEDSNLKSQNFSTPIYLLLIVVVLFFSRTGLLNASHRGPYVSVFLIAGVLAYDIVYEHGLGPVNTGDTTCFCTSSFKPSDH
jgi:hypothetical protein